MGAEDVLGKLAKLVVCFLTPPPGAATLPGSWPLLYLGNKIPTPRAPPQRGRLVAWATRASQSRGRDPHPARPKSEGPGLWPQHSRPLHQHLRSVSGTDPSHIFSLLSCLLPQASEGVPNSQTIWGPGEGDENVDGPSLRFRGSPATSSSLQPAKHRGWVITKGYLCPRAVPHFLEGTP